MDFILRKTRYYLHENVLELNEAKTMLLVIFLNLKTHLERKGGRELLLERKDGASPGKVGELLLARKGEGASPRKGGGNFCSIKT